MTPRRSGFLRRRARLDDHELGAGVGAHGRGAGGGRRAVDRNPARHRADQRRVQLGTGQAGARPRVSPSSATTRTSSTSTIDPKDDWVFRATPDVSMFSALRFAKISAYVGSQLGYYKTYISENSAGYEYRGRVDLLASRFQPFIGGGETQRPHAAERRNRHAGRPEGAGTVGRTGLLARARTRKVYRRRVAQQHRVLQCGRGRRRPVRIAQPGRHELLGRRANRADAAHHADGVRFASRRTGSNPRRCGTPTPAA